MLLLKVYYIDILYFSRYCVESENYSPTVTPNVISICEKSREILENFTSISIYTLKQCVHFLSMITLSKRDMFSNVCLLLKFLYKQKFLYQIENFVENLLYDKRIEFSQSTGNRFVPLVLFPPLSSSFQPTSCLFFRCLSTYSQSQNIKLL